MKRDFLSLLSYGKDESLSLFEHAMQLKQATRESTLKYPGRTVLLFFEKPSTRTRLSFEAAVHQLGAQTVFLSPATSQTSRGETVEDSAHMFGLFADLVIVRTSTHERLMTMADCCRVPIVNALTDLYHPCQTLADVLTLQEEFGRLEGLRVAYIGDGNNIAHSLAAGAAVFGYQLAIACPKSYAPDPEVLKTCRQAGAEIVVSDDPGEMARGASALYTDVWVSMGQDEEASERQQIFAPYQVNEALMNQAEDHAIFLHCLPAHRGEEVSSQVIDGSQSRIFVQAENRLHAQKGLVDRLLG